MAGKRSSAPFRTQKVDVACLSYMSAISSIDEFLLPARANATARQTAVAEPLSDHCLLEAARTGDEAAFRGIGQALSQPDHKLRLSPDQ